jgi:hypothetical protein
MERRGFAMMGRLKNDQGKLFYSFCLEEVVPDDHLVRGIAAVLDLSWVHSELAPYYPRIGRAAPAFALSTEPPVGALSLRAIP